MKEGEIMQISVTPREAAQLTSLSRETIMAAMMSGCIHYVTVGKDGHKNIILVSELEKFLENCSQLGLCINSDPTHMAEIAATIHENIKN